MVDEVKVMARGHSSCSASSLGHSVVSLVQSLVHIDASIDDSLTVIGLGRETIISHRQMVRSHVLQTQRQLTQE